MTIKVGRLPAAPGPRACPGAEPQSALRLVADALRPLTLGDLLFGAALFLFVFALPAIFGGV